MIMKKKILSVLLALCMVLALLPVSALAAADVDTTNKVVVVHDLAELRAAIAVENVETYNGYTIQLDPNSQNSDWVVSDGDYIDFFWREDYDAATDSTVNVMLDLTDHTIDFTHEDSTIWVNPGVHLTIKNGTLKRSGNTSARILINADTTVFEDTMNGIGMIENQAEMEIKGGTYQSNGPFEALINTNAEPKTDHHLVIRGGTFTGTSEDPLATLISNGGNMEIYGGDFTAAPGGSSGTVIFNAGDMYVHGGNFENTNPEQTVHSVFQNSAYIFDGVVDDRTNILHIYNANITSENGSGIGNFYNAETTIDNATVNTYYSALDGNNLEAKEMITINGGSFTSETDACIYMPSDGELNINGGTFTGLTGICAVMGTINISGDTVIKAVAADEAHPYNTEEEIKTLSGSKCDGSAILLIPKKYHVCKDDPGLYLNITGGNVSGGITTYAARTAGAGIPKIINADPSVPSINIMEGANSNAASQTTEYEVTGGTFSAPPCEQFLEEAFEENVAELKSATVNSADAPYSYYTTVEEAVEAVEEANATDAEITEKNPSNPTIEPVTLKLVNGSTAVGTYTVAPGTEVTLPTLENSGSAIFIGWTDESGTNTYTGTYTVNMSEVLSASWVDGSSGEPVDPPQPPQPVNPFTDVKEGDYYYDAVQWAVKNKVTDGTSATKFSPDKTCTRAEAVTFLWRAAGSPEPATTTNPFVDVAPNAYYYKAVLWAVENNITNGTSTTKFSPDKVCVRAQIVTFLWRAAKTPAATGITSFTDVEADSYYTTAVQWAVENDITNGTSTTKFSPTDNCKRGQIVTFLYRSQAK